jgi:alpha-beta hydrolase superfamily lysophospholipase
MGRYAHVADHLQRVGWICVGYDHPGHGRSDGIRGRLPQEQALVQALIHVALHVINELPTRVAQDLPFVLIGHSMGGLVVAESLRSSANELPDIAAVVLSAPAFGAPVPAWQKLALRAFAGLVPDLAMDHAIQPQWICRDTAAVKRYLSDPLVHRRVSLRLGHWILESGDRVVADAGEWRHPSLILSAGSERLVSNRAIETFLARAPSGMVDHHHEPAMFHEMFNDAEHQRVLRAVSRWLDARALLPLA